MANVTFQIQTKHGVQDVVVSQQLIDLYTQYRVEDNNNLDLMKRCLGLAQQHSVDKLGHIDNDFVMNLILDIGLFLDGETA